MRSFFEYIFYRIYLRYDEKDSPLTIASVISVSIFLSITSVIWFNIMFLCYTEIPKQHYWFSILCIIISYIYFLKRKDKILLRFKDSIWNKRIPIWAIWMLLPVSFIGGIYPAFLLKGTIEDYHLQGCIGRWLASLW